MIFQVKFVPLVEPVSEVSVKESMKLTNRNNDVFVQVKSSPVFLVLCLPVSAGSGLFNIDKISACLL